MSDATTRDEAKVVLSRRYAAPREKVFRAWTEPAKLMKWFAPSDEHSTPSAEVDLRAGGRYRIVMRHEKKGAEYIVGGTYREVRPPEKLVFTWAWESPPMNTFESVVTVDLHDRGGETELVLTHEQFPSQDVAAEHNKGWSGCLDRLAIALNA